MIGQKFGKLTVLEESEQRIRKRICWKCKCDCGNELIVIGTDLRTGRKTHCGCSNLNKTNEIGNRYGRLVVIDEIQERDANRAIKWLCQCDCGNTTIVIGRDLRQGKTKSCGCLEQQNRGQNILIDEIGHQYGKLTVIDKIRPDNKTTFWKCQCECGNITYVKGPDLRQGKVSSCGCLTSKGNALIQKILENKKINFKTEVAFKNFVSQKNGHPRFDFAIYNSQNELLCLIEYQGEQHYMDKGEFGKTQRTETDLLKKIYCQDNNISLYEIKYTDNIEQKLNSILEILNNDY